MAIAGGNPAIVMPMGPRNAASFPKSGAVIAVPKKVAPGH